MRKIYTACLCKCFLLFISILVLQKINAQTTVATPYTGSFTSFASPANISFVAQNTNAGDIILTGVSQYCETTENNSVWELYYSSTSLSGVGTPVPGAAWTLLATSAPVPVAANGVVPVFTALNFTIPAGAQYRFVMKNTGPGSTRYILTPAPNVNTVSNGGVNLFLGNYQIAGANVGYSGQTTALGTTPRYWHGSITFMQSGPCTTPPNPGSATATPSTPICVGTAVQLNLTGNTSGTGQTFVWQSSSTSGGTYIDISSSSSSSSFSVSPTTSTWYRAAVTCGGNTQYSAPVQVVVNPAFPGGTYTINSGTATGGTNFQSFTDAVAALSCGISGPVIFNVVAGSGPYNEQITIPAIGGTSAINTVTFNGNGRTLSFNSTTSTARAGITLNGANFITFDNLVVDGSAGTYGWGFLLTGGANENAISNCIINVSQTNTTSGNHAGIVISGSLSSATTSGNNGNNNTISGNTVNGGYYGIICYGNSTAGAQNTGNIVNNNIIQNVYGYSIYLAYQTGALVRENNISRPTRASGLSSGAGIYVTTGNINTLVEKNRVHNMFDAMPTSTSTLYGIYVGADGTAGQENKLWNNLIYNIGGNATIYGIYNTGAPYMQAYHNTIALDDQAATTGAAYGFYQTTAATNLDFRNNIVTVSRSGTGIKRCLYFVTTTSSIVSNKNVLQMNAAAGTNNHLGQYGTTNYTTLGDWQTANSSAYDQQSISIDPLFANAAAGNYAPLAAGVNNIGDNVGVTIDILNNPRTLASPDPGAYEIALTGCTNPPTPGTATTSDDIICAGENFTLNLTGNSVGDNQTYQWQSSPDNSTWANIGSPLTTPAYSTSQSPGITYYRAAIQCSGGTIVYSTSVTVNSPNLVSGTFTINSALPTGGTNFNSFNDAYNYIRCGINGPVVFNVDPASGPYTEQLILNDVAGSSATNTITFNGNGRIIQFLSTNTNERAVIKLDGANYFIFDSLTINATASTTTDYGFGVQLLNNADSNIVRSCAINITMAQTSLNHVGISISASATSATTTGNTLCDDNLFEDNVITGGYYGITNYGSSTVANQRNKFLRNTIKDFYLYGIANNGTFQTMIDGNNISRPTRTNLSTGTSAGVFFTGLSTSARVNGNHIHDMLGGNTTLANDVYGIYFTAVDALAGLENVVSNNVIYDIKSNGIIYGLYNVGSDNVLYYHNTISLEDNTSTTTDVTRGFYQTTAAAGIVLRNNIITLGRGGTGLQHGLYFNTPGSSIISNNNDVFFNPLPNILYGYNGTDHSILADWQAATGQDANSVSNNPLYTNPATGNFKPTNAVIDNLGAPMGILTDVLGLPRSATTPDIGAYEFAPPPCTSPPTPGTATVSATPVCENTLVALGATGFSVGATQTYQWQSSVNIGGPYTDISAMSNSPSFTITATETLYYRLAVTCSGNTQYSAPVLLSVNPGLPGGTYTIDATQPASATNFINFNAAKDAMACGITGPVVFNVEAGTGPYLEQLLLDSIPGTSAVNTITFNGNSNVIRFSSSNTAERAVIRLGGTDYTTFNNLTIDANGGTYGWGVWLLNGADSNAFNNCIILSSTTSTSSTNFAGVVITGSTTTPNSATASNCDGNVFNGNSITGGYYGMTMMSSTAAPIRNNKFINNQVKDFYSYGIYVGNTIDGLIEKNVMSRPTRTSITIHYGIYGGGTTNINLSVSKNRITNPTGGLNSNTSTLYGIYFAADGGVGQEAKVTNNIIDNFDGAGAIYALYNSSANNVHYYHNTISLDNAANSSTGLSRGFYQTGTAAGIVFKNNIISITRGGSGQKHAVYFGTAASTITSNRNDLYVDPATSTAYVGYFGGNQATLASWQTASSQDANSYSVDPQFINAIGGNFTPQQALIDDKGEPVGITSDFLNAPRSLTTPDLGAIEFAVIPCIAPPVAGTSTVNPSTGICLGTKITLDLTGNSTGGYQKYIWQRGPSAAGPWEDISDTLYSAPFIHELASYSNFYFRAIVICGTGTAFSVPVPVTINAALLAGDYTIDPAQPAGATNYQSFATAVAALQCGIAGSVRFHVVPGTYTEQIIIKKVPGASAASTVTFTSQNGLASSVNLTYNSTNATDNYVLKLDSASFITFKDLSVTATNTTNGRAVEFAGTASSDSLLRCVIDVPAASSTATTVVGVFGTALTGNNNVLKGNTITDGSSNIYLSGTAGVSKQFVLDSNTVSSAYYYGIYSSGINGIRVSKNIVTRSGLLNTTAYGIYLTNCDSVYRVDDNNVTIANAGTTNYAIYLTGCAADVLQPGSVSRNKIVAVNNITSATLYGLYQATSVNNYTVNNVIDVSSSGATVRGLYSSGGGGMKYYNNTVRNSSPSTATTNVAAYFSQTTATADVTDIRNNVFYHAAGGVAVYQGNTVNIFSDFNMLYTSGPTLVLQGTVPYTNLQAWRDAHFWDYNSIVYSPALVAGSSLAPDVANANVWAMHGRGVQVADNASDINGNPRPTTLITGVPDLGAYEFLPTVLPPVLPATPVAPAAGTTQVFMFGTDTVQKITWNAASTVPTNVEVRRYSGIIPPGLAAGQQSMYFYTDVNSTGSAPTSFNMQQFYIDPWMRDIPSEPTVKMGRTNSAGAWLASSNSTVQTFPNVITEQNLNFLDMFTGMTDGVAPPDGGGLITTDTSNRGRRFWVGYGHHSFFNANDQSMVLYLSAEQAANVTVKVNGTNWQRSYAVPANSVRLTDLLPKSGLTDARLRDEGLFNTGISIESDVPIVVYAHIYAGLNSGATMLLPVGTYGYEYISLNASQFYPTVGAGPHSWFYVIADRDSTLVEITPSNPTKGGRPAGVPFQVYLNKGQVYNVMGTITTNSVGTFGVDMSGSTIKSIPNASGKCYPIAAFSGSSRTSLCNDYGGDNLIQQMFPNQAWGTKFLTFGTAKSGAFPTTYNSNKWRILVKDPATVVKRNGVTIDPATLVLPGNYYEFGITQGDGPSTSSYIEADQPIMVAQYMLSLGGADCPGLAAPTGLSDPEMIYISPIEQGIKRAVFYNTGVSNIQANYINVIIPTTGLSSLRIDGVGSFTDVFAHPHLAGYTCVRHNLPAAAGQHIIVSDSAFFAITYGMGSEESYGYNAGTLVKNLTALPSINNVFNTGNTSTYTCKNTPFNLRIQLSVKPTQLIWNLAQVPNLTPNANVVQNNPVPTDSVTINNKKFYIFTLPQNYSFSAVGTYSIPINVFHPSIEGCSGSIEIILPVAVIPAPISDFTVSAPNCAGEQVQFNASTTTSNGVPVNQWTWNFGDNSTGAGQNPVHTYATAGTFSVALRGIADDGCVGDTTKSVIISGKPIPVIVQDTLFVCNNASATFTVQNPVTGVTYTWYDAATAGTLIGTGTSVSINNVTGLVNVYLEAALGGCVSITRDRATAAILPALATPVAVVDSVDVSMIRFRWSAVPNATGYEVSINNGATWAAPSSGATGLTHTITGLALGTSVTLQVRALGGCLPTVSAAVTGQTRTDQVFIPNSFTPNGDGRNDVLRVYSNVIRQLKIAIFNQWGEKVYESTDQNMAWDGTYKGKPQPSGVYIYVAEIVINTGEKISRKGSINLVR